MAADEMHAVSIPNTVLVTTWSMTPASTQLTMHWKHTCTHQLTS